ncbi:AAA family ATPase [Halorussus halophilus]|uniref:AAA family ATPase n=1 Tax=Halorussus halophilus TaxID=2650975 RepID=UPI00130166EE|nr:AAA family ATPase [Halorussus halophilus]
MTDSTTALVGATGGAGTTRLAVELGATLARDGRTVAVVDAAFATEGLARHVSGRIDTDLTTLLTDETDSPLDAGLYEQQVSDDVTGELALCPARAAFERMARAKTAGAAERFVTLLADANERFDHVLVDTPPVAANQAVAAITSADRVAVVAPASERGVDALQRTRGRITDVGAAVDSVVANQAEGDSPMRSADAVVPESETTTVENVPASVTDTDSAFAPAIANAAEVVCEVELTLEFEEPGMLDLDTEEYLPDALR